MVGATRAHPGFELAADFNRHGMIDLRLLQRYVHQLLPMAKRALHPYLRAVRYRRISDFNRVSHEFTSIGFLMRRCPILWRRRLAAGLHITSQETTGTDIPAPHRLTAR